MRTLADHRPPPRRAAFLGAVAALLAALIQTAPARADVFNVVVVPGTIDVNAAGDAVVTVRYRVTLNPGTFADPVIRSTAAELVDVGGGATLAVVGGPIQRNAGLNGVTTITEQIRVPRAVALRVAAGDNIDLRRTFNQEVTPGSGLASANLRASSAGALALRSLTLRFDDESQYRVLRRDAALRAQARLQTTGRGRIDGVWEVSGPAFNTPSVFRRIGQAQKRVAAGGTTLFESPKLPTDRPGLYKVRFLPRRDGDARFNDAFPVLQYFVTQTETLRELQILEPPAGAALGSASRFRWAADPAAAAYRLEFRGRRSLSGAGARRIAAVDVAAGDALPSATLRPFTLARLRRERAVYWRVVAYDAAGRPLSSSPLRRLGEGLGANESLRP